MRRLIERFEQASLEEASAWKKVGGAKVKDGPKAKMVITEQQGPGIPIYVLHMEFKETGTIMKWRGQKTKQRDLITLANRWYKIVHTDGSIDFSREWKRVDALPISESRSGGDLLGELLAALGWQGGTVHQVVREVKRLRALEKKCKG